MHAQSSRLAAALSLAFATAACTTAPGPEPVGHVELALVTTSATGYTYQLPLGSFVRVEGDGFADDFGLDGDITVASFAVPVGEYTATLGHPYGFTSDWILTRTDVFGESDAVTAKLVSAQAVPITIESDETTEVSYTFRVANGEVVTFERGELQVSFDIEEVVADNTYFSSQSLAEVLDVTIGASAPNALADWWPEAGTPNVDVRLAGVVGKWTPRSSIAACAKLEVANRVLFNEPALADLLEEAALGDEAEVCVYSQAGQHWFEVLFERSGPASTETLSDLGQADYDFSATFWFEVPEQVYTGEKLDPTKLEGLGQVPFSGEFRMSAESGEWFSANLDGTSNFAFQPIAE